MRQCGHDHGENDQRHAREQQHGVALRRFHVAFDRADDQRQSDADRKRHAHSSGIDAHHQEYVREVKNAPR